MLLFINIPCTIGQLSAWLFDFSLRDVLESNTIIQVEGYRQTAHVAVIASFGTRTDNPVETVIHECRDIWYRWGSPDVVGSCTILKSFHVIYIFHTFYNCGQTAGRSEIQSVRKVLFEV